MIFSNKISAYEYVDYLQLRRKCVRVVDLNTCGLFDVEDGSRYSGRAL